MSDGVSFMFIKDAIDQYLEWKAVSASKAPQTYRVVLNHFKEYIKKDTKDITLFDIVRFHQLFKTKYSPAYCAYLMTILKNFFGFAMRRGWSIVDPIDINIPKYIQKPRDVVKKEDYDKQCKILDQYNFYDLERLVILRMLWETGMRVSELCDLNIQDLDSTVTYTQIVTKKAKQYRWVMWSKETHRLLLNYLGVRLDLNQEHHLFVTTYGHRRKRITPRTIERWIIEICQRAGTKVYSPHCYRHAKAHNLISQGANVKEIQVALGHSEDNPRAAFQYLELDKRETLNILSKYLHNS